MKKKDNHIIELKTDKDPVLSDFKLAIKQLALTIKDAAKTSEGKKLPSDYWVGMVNLIKKAKLGISMIDVGIDDIDKFKDMMEPEDLTLKKTGPITKSDDAEPTTSQDSSTAQVTTSQPSSDSSEKEPEDEEDEENVTEEAKSKSQQRLFGMVHAYNKGELDKGEINSDLLSKIKKIASGMNDKDAKKIAKTNHDDLPEKVPTNEYVDTLNHLEILLSEENVGNITKTDTGFLIEKDERKFIIDFDQNFYLKSDHYNFNIGDDYDLSEVVSVFKKLISHTDRQLKKDYELSVRS